MTRGAFAPLVLFAACASPPLGDRKAEPPTDASSPAPSASAASLPASPPKQQDGALFPDHVIALTWDDGPDAHTLALAKYLHDRRAPSTFFVVGGWTPGISDEPGKGDEPWTSGADKLPILGELVRLGHRVGNHTQSHALLWDAPPEVVRRELAVMQAKLAPLQTNEAALFRVPGGAWSASAADAVAADPGLARLVGPFRWDVDAKDWEASLHCDTAASSECEPGPDGSRVKPEVVAARYVAAIDAARRGIVLLHDRVGHVGSTYALRLAKALVPALEAKRYVFAAPLLRFSPLAPRRLEPAAIARASGGGALRGDVDGDGRLDACSRTATGISCTLAVVKGAGVPAAWSSHDFSDDDAVPWKRGYEASLALGDLNGDGRADLCGRGPQGVVCALSSGRGFTAARVWAAEGLRDEDGWAPSDRAFALVDVNGDGRADMCILHAGTAECGMAP